MRQVIGLVGYIASGKSTVSQYFIDRGFKYFKLSDVIRKECLARKLEINRVNLQNVGNELRKTHAASYLVERTLKDASHAKKVIIDGIRNPEEITFLRDHSQAFILGIKAPKPLRLERYLSRLAERGEDGMTKAAFHKADRREKGVGEGADGQQVKACLTMTDYTLNNKSSHENLIAHCEGLFKTNFFSGKIPVIG